MHSLKYQEYTCPHGGQHPDIAVQIAQWCNSSFALQVSQWTRQLILLGNVTLGQEKTNKELEERFIQLTQYYKLLDYLKISYYYNKK